jgi:hypothetical protein
MQKYGADNDDATARNCSLCVSRELLFGMIRTSDELVRFDKKADKHDAIFLIK